MATSRAPGTVTTSRRPANNSVWADARARRGPQATQNPTWPNCPTEVLGGNFALDNLLENLINPPKNEAAGFILRGLIILLAVKGNSLKWAALYLGSKPRAYESFKFGAGRGLYLFLGCFEGPQGSEIGQTPWGNGLKEADRMQKVI